MSLKVVIDGAPVPKARPRLGRNGVYTPTCAYENEVAKVLLPYRGRYVKSRRVGVSILFYGASKKSDLDNLGKLYLDALCKAQVIKDDRYVYALWLERKEADSEGPRTEIIVGDWDE